MKRDNQDYAASLVSSDRLIEDNPNFSIIRPVFSRHSSITSNKSNVSKSEDLQSLLGNGSFADSTQNTSTKLIRDKTDILVIVSMAMIYFVGVSAFSIISPFFAPEANSKGANGTVTGLIFAVYPFIVVIFSPIVGKLLPVFGPKSCLIVGCFVEGVSEILFGFVAEMQSGTMFICYCFVIRSVTAIGSACSQTAVLAIVSVTFRDNLSTMFGVLELFAGLGYMAGPALGGWLYHVGGFRLPFIVLGASVLVVLLCVAFLLPGDQHYQDSLTRSTEMKTINVKTGSLKQALSVPGVLALSAVSVVGAMVLSFLDPTFTNHLNVITAPKILSSEKIGLIFLIPSFTYMLSAPVVGILTDKCLNKRYTILFGCVLSAVCYLFLGPSPIIRSAIPATLLIICVAFGILGFSISPFLIPVLADMTESAKNAGLPDNLATTGVISGIFNSAFSIGEMIGPTLGGALTDQFTFEWASTIFVFVLVFEFVMLLIFSLWEKTSKRSRKKKKRQNKITPSDTENCQEI